MHLIRRDAWTYALMVLLAILPGAQSAGAQSNAPRRNIQNAIIVKLDLATSVAALVVMMDRHSSFDIENSLTVGSAFFVTESAAPGSEVGGSHFAGVIRTRFQTKELDLLPTNRRRIRGHEMVHLTHYDFSFIAWAEPMEKYLLGKIPGGHWVNRYVDLGINAPVWSGLNSLIPYDHRPWEREASILADQ